MGPRISQAVKESLSCDLDFSSQEKALGETAEGAGEMAQLVKCLSCKHGDLSDPKFPCLHSVTCASSAELNQRAPDEPQSPSDKSSFKEQGEYMAV